MGRELRKAAMLRDIPAIMVPGGHRYCGVQYLVCLNPVVRVVRSSWASAVVDKVNLVDEWSTEFRVSYKAIWTSKACALDDTTTVAISGPVEESSQTESVINAIGSRPAAFQFEKRDCEGENITNTFRDIQYPCSGHQFRDLD
jgi:hypothetical protein